MNVISRLFLPLLLAVVAVAPATAAQLPEPAALADVRVLIDVSGSMKKNDPHNLRRPALDLLVRLFPAGARGGVWAFGHDVEVMVAHRDIDTQWRQEGEQQARQIHSNALFTDIPAALATAISDAEQLDSTRRTSIILLTDGMVDISKSAATNAAARQQLLDELAPRLQALGVHVHTVALSDEADHELLERLALVTDGIHAVAKDAEELQRIFVQALDSAAPSEQLPLTNNRFLVDSSVDELTALVFHDGTAMTLVAPDGNHHSATEHGDDFAWHRGEGYELVTITRPYEGEWRLEGDVENGSRITIVSNLSLAASRLPDNLFPGEPPQLTAVLREDGEPLTRSELLALVDFSVQLTRLSSAANPAQLWQVPLQRDGDAFSTLLPELVAEPGEYELAVIADGKTFQRSLKQRITVRDHFVLQASTTEDVPARHRLRLNLINPAVAVEDVTVTATLQTGAGEPQPLQPAVSGERSWEVMVDIAEQRRELNWEAAFQLPGADGDSAAVWRSGSMVLEGNHVEQSALPALLLDAAEAEVPASEAPTEPTVEEPTPAPITALATAAPRPWLLYAGLAVGNLLLIGLAVFAYRKIVGSATPGAVEESESSVAPDVPAAAPEPEPSLDDLDLPLDAIDLDPAAQERS